MYKTTGGTHKSYGVDTEASKRIQNFGVGRKFRGTNSLRGGGETQSYGVNTPLWSEQKVPQWTKFRSGHTVTATVYLTKRNLQTTKLPGVS